MAGSRRHPERSRPPPVQVSDEHRFHGGAKLIGYGYEELGGILRPGPTDPVLLGVLAGRLR
jgi:hypothetical protein